MDGTGASEEKTPQVEVTTPPSSTELKPKDAVTPEILSEILKGLNRPEVEVIDFEAKPGTKAGDNYMSLMFAVKINLKDVKTGETETLPLMLKVMPRNEIRVKTIVDAKIFVRDVKFYQEIIPAMEKFQRDIVGLPEDQLLQPWPKCYGSKNDNKNDYIVMEDLKVKGFCMASRQAGLDFDHCKLVLENLARFHALSFAMFQGNFDVILEKYPYLEETMYVEEKIPDFFKDVIKNTYNKQAAILREAGEQLGANLLEKVYSDTYFQEMFQLVGGKVKWAVIGHGDCWTNNLLFRYDNATNKPIEVKFVDFQVCRAASPTVDILYFLYSSPQVHILNEREAELVKIYFEEFSKFAVKLNVDLNAHEFTKENFDKEFARMRYYGAISGLMLALVTSAESTDVPEMETLTEDDMTRDGDNFFMKMMKDKALEKVKNIAGVHLPKCQQVQKYL